MPCKMIDRTAVVALAAGLLALPVGAQMVDFGKYPDWKGQWVRPEENLADQAAGGPGNGVLSKATPQLGSGPIAKRETTTAAAPVGPSSGPARSVLARASG